MHMRMARLTLRTAAIALALSGGATLALADEDPPPTPETGIEQGLHPEAKLPVSEADIAECMKSWDPSTQMSRQEYEEACKRSLQYDPEESD